MRYTIHLNCELEMHLGITPQERETTQQVHITARIDYSRKNREDTIDTTLNYSKIVDDIKSVCAKPYQLLETLADTICETLLKKYEIETIYLTINKPDALKNKNAQVSVSVTRP